MSPPPNLAAETPELLTGTPPRPDAAPVCFPRELKVGDSLGKLLLTDAMGEGATGRVFRALHQTLKIPVAVKILQSAELERDPGLRQQLRAEAQILAQLNHPNIIRVWDYEDNPDLPYVVLEIVEGLSLAELISQSGRLAARHALDVVTQVADGLGAAHRLGIIHRDVKPGNILITKARVPKLVDLGLAVVSPAGRALQNATDSGRLVDIVGTPAYMAPEQFLAPEHVDHRSDIYSLGVTFYHALTGRLPFEGHSPRQVMLNKVQHLFIPPHEIVSGLNGAVSEVVLHMMQKDPDDRYLDYEELLGELRVLKNVLQVQSPDFRPPPLSVGSRSSQNLSAPEAPRPRTPPPTTTPPATDQPSSEVDTALGTRTLKVGQAPALTGRLLEAAQLAGKGGDRPRACELLRHAVRLDPSGEAAWLWLAAMTDAAGEKFEALSHVLDLNPDHEKARAGLRAVALQAGVAEVRDGDRAKARRYLAKATELDPRQETAWLWRAKAAEAPEEAVACLRRALEINPHNERARAGLEWHQASAAAPSWTCPLCQVRAAKPAKSCPSCNALLVLADLPTWRSRPPLRAELVRQAEARYLPAVRTKPDAVAHFALALAYLNGGAFDKALKHLREAARLRPADVALSRQVEAIERQLAAAETSEASRGWQGTVLVVDDSPTIRKVVARALADYDYRILEAADGEAALAIARKDPPDLVLLDITMPGMDGYQVCRALRAEAANADLPVLMLSGRDGLFDKLRGRLAGATEYVTKPFRAELLVQVVEKHCLPRRERRAGRKK